MTSCIDWPRTASGDCSPIAHSTASVTLDLPEPLGPTIDRHAGPELQARAVGERLEALEGERLQVHVRPRRPRRVEHLERRARGLLLGGLLRAPRAGADLARSPTAARRPRTCGRAAARLGGDLVGDDLAALRQALLQRGLEVDRVLERLLDLRRERLDDRRGGALVAGVQVAGADHRLDDRGEHALGLHERRGALADAVGRRGGSRAGTPEALGDRAARRARHRLGADLRQPPRAVALGLQARIQVRGDRQAEHRSPRNASRE